jgi:hypothetical protein
VGGRLRAQHRYHTPYSPSLLLPHSTTIQITSISTSTASVPQQQDGRAPSDPIFSTVFGLQRARGAQHCDITGFHNRHKQTTLLPTSELSHQQTQGIILTTKKKRKKKKKGELCVRTSKPKNCVFAAYKYISTLNTKLLLRIRATNIRTQKTTF